VGGRQQHEVPQKEVRSHFSVNGNNFMYCNWCGVLSFNILPLYYVRYLIMVHNFTFWWFCEYINGYCSYSYNKTNYMH